MCMDRLKVQRGEGLEIYIGGINPGYRELV